MIVMRYVPVATPFPTQRYRVEEFEYLLLLGNVVLEEESHAVTPAGTPAMLNVTSPVAAPVDDVIAMVEDELPPGFTFSVEAFADRMRSERIVSVYDSETPLQDAVSVASVVVGTRVVVIGNEIPLFPAATVTVLGTAAAGLLLERFTTAPPVGAKAFR